MRSATDYKQIVLVNFDLSKIDHFFYKKEKTIIKLSAGYRFSCDFTGEKKQMKESACYFVV